jgi:Flp pilus assembly protein TadD
MISHLPVIYHGGEPKDALMIGLASGISVGSLLTHSLDRVETVELMPSMKEAARHFDDHNHRCLDDPRHRLIMNDGRNHLLLTDKKYDIIVSEPSNPWIAGVGSLFTREFFELTKERLEPGGVVCQWVQTYQFHENDLKTVLATFLDAYPHLHLWQAGPGDLILVASLEPLTIDTDRFGEMLRRRPGEDFASLEILPMAQILSLFVTDRDGIESFVGSWRGRVTDDNLYLEYAVPRHMFETENRVDVTSLDRVVTSPLPFLKGSAVDPGLGEQINRYRRARAIALRARLRKQYPEGTSSPEEAGIVALRIAPDELMSRWLYSNSVNETANQALEAGNLEAAEPGFRRIAVAGVREERAMALNNLGWIAYQNGDRDSAQVFWEAAIREEPGYPLVLGNLALLASLKNDNEKAVAYLQKAITLAPRNARFLNNLAYGMALSDGDLVEAEMRARKAVELEPDPNHRDTLGFILIKQGRWAEAERILLAVVRESPDAFESYLHLGMAQAGAGRIEDARRSLRTVIEGSQDPDLTSRANEYLNQL